MIAGFLYFEQPPAIDAVYRLVQQRLFEIPRFRCRLDCEPETQTVWWQELTQEDMEMKYHVQMVEGAEQMTDADINTFISRVWSSGFDVDKPPWTLYLLDRGSRAQSIIIIAVSHALVDGIGAIAALLACLDEPPPMEEKLERKVPLVQREKPPFSLGSQLRAWVRGIKVGLSTPVMSPDVDNPLKLRDPHALSHHKTLSFTPDISLAKVRALKEKYGNATVTDVLIAVLTVTLKNYFSRKGKVPAAVRGNFPINLRQAGSDVLAESMGNHFATAMFTFKLNYSHVDQVVYEVKEQCDYIKHSPAPKIEQLALKYGERQIKKGLAGRVDVMKRTLDVFGK
eukprot:g75948.t1